MNAFNPGRRVLAVLIGEEDIHRISTALPEISILQIPVSEKDWNDHLSPWPAEKVFRKGTDFSGHADSFLKDQVTILRFSSADILLPVSSLCMRLPESRALME